MWRAPLWLLRLSDCWGHNMSASIATFEKFAKIGDEESGEMHLQAFMGGDAGAAVQFSIHQNGRHCYACLSEGQLRTLISLIELRINKGITATGDDLDLMISDDGRIFRSRE